MKKVLVIGFDCLTPQLVFDRFASELPTFSRMREMGIWGKMRSTDPPITVPAWTSMMTSKDPGTLGFYGFRNRKDHSYDKMYFANAAAVRDKTVWDIFSSLEKRCIVFGVPQTFPPSPVNGIKVSSFLTPDKASGYTFPADFADKLEEVSGGYMIDVDEFRTEDKDRLLKDIYVMTERRFKAFNHLLKEEAWEFAMMVEMGPDRIHHGFWKYGDPEHPKFEKGNPYESVLIDYYKCLDQQLAQTLEIIDEETAVIIVSDHGAQSMIGGICVNEWLIREGLLTLKEKPPGVSKLTPEMIDWPNTRVWGEGGYYSRIFFNVAGREPEGVIPQDDYESFREEMIQKIEGLGDDKGDPIGTRAQKPEDLYKKVNGVAPDLVVYFGNLAWRSVGSVGMDTIHTFENDTGPDDANHAQHGIFIMAGEGIPQDKALNRMDILDVAPTILSLMDVGVPADMQGNSLVASSGTEAVQSAGAASADDGYSQAEQDEVAKRLEDLGYI